MSTRYQGVFPVVPTIFDAHGALDLDGQRRCIDFMIDAGSHGLCIHANYSEQFALGDDERDLLTRTTLEHVAARVPVIVTTSHFSARICAQRNRHAQALGAAMVMAMPPYHGATFRVSDAQIRAYFREIADGLAIPLMIQDAPASGVALPASLLA
ncbi:dihydrodipicolinate synthase family protein, partial [Burkholderia ubonensis]|uniref:dihydrodipicolinate synthase family protein n=2 Tax=Burkholderia TaxID=32008 RepID=UPI000AEBA732